MSWVIVLALLLFFWTVGLLVLDGPSLRRFDSAADDPRQYGGEIFDAHPDDEQATLRFLQMHKRMRHDTISTKSYKKGIQVIRDFADNLSAELESDCTFSPVSADGVDAEWVVAPGADPKRRVLMLHGGAFFIGSAKGHRLFSDRLATIANAAVLCINYRMLPEHKRMASVEDAQKAYRWILKHGPEGSTELDTLIVAGDSAGGNLAMMLSNWSRNQGLTRPTAVIGFSPSLDSTMSSASARSNVKTDIVLGNSIGALTKLPKALYLWIGALLMRVNPSNSLVSPLFDDLSALPPTLIHASSNEILRDDAIRYTNKARAAGSDVTLQIWKNQVHDWHLFYPDTGSGAAAWQQVAKFLQRF